MNALEWIELKKKYDLFPEDRSNEFGSANTLETRGSVFDFCQNDESEDLPLASPSRESVAERGPNQRFSENEGTAPFSRTYEDVYDDSNAALSEPVSAWESDDLVPAESGKALKKGVSAKVKLICALFAAVALMTAGLVFFLTHAVLGDIFATHKIYSSGTRIINLSGSDFEDYSPLSKVRALEEINLTNSSFSRLSDLYGCSNLKKVIIRDKVLSAEECISFYREVPNALLVCGVEIDGVIYDSELSYLKVASADADTQRLYAALAAAKTLDMTECSVSDETYRELSGSLPDCMIVIRSELAGTEYTTDAQSIDLAGTLTEEDVARLEYFKHLKKADLRQCKNPEILKDYISSHPDVRWNKPVELLGKQVGTEDETVDLRGGKYTLRNVTEALDAVLPKMKSLKKIDMCGCGLSDKEMRRLSDDYPQIKFVWMVHFKNFAVRTDAVVFSAESADGNELSGLKDCEPLLEYCTDLIGLDLAHCEVTDISGIASMRKLRAVNFSDNLITDMSVFSQLPDLEFIEMNSGNRVKNVDSLRGLQKLRFVNFWSNSEIEDLSPLYDHENLKIAIFHYTIPKKEREWFRKSNPDCHVFYKVDSNMISTNQEWRDNPYRKKFRKAAGNWMYVVGFNVQTGEYIFDFNTDQYRYK